MTKSGFKKLKNRLSNVNDVYFYFILGALLAQGSPLGFLLFHMIMSSDFISLSDLVIRHQLELLYMWIGTTVVFSGFGFVLGNMISKLKNITVLKNRFMGVISHDLRNPISNIINLVQVLEDSKDILPENQVVVLDNLKRVSRYTLLLTQDILDLSKIESGSFELRYESIDSYLALSNALDYLELDAKTKNITIAREFKNLELKIDVDPLRFRQCIINVVSNAIKFSPVGSKVTVSFFKEKDSICIDVIDQGKGISKVDQAKLFRPFTTTSTVATTKELSTGLGLYIVKKIIEKHGGLISLTSELNHGTSVKLVFPIKSKAAESSKNPIILSKSSIKTLIFVDDSQEAIDILRVYLKGSVHKCYFFTSPLEVLDLYRSKSSILEYGIVLFTDENMPGMSGHELLKSIRSLEGDDTLKRTVIVALTGNDSAHGDFDYFMQKPVSKLNLQKLISESYAQS